MFLGPSYTDSLEIPFRLDNEDMFSHSQRFSIDISELHFFHDFFAIDMLFNSGCNEIMQFKISAYFYSFMLLGTRLEEKQEMPTREFTIVFSNTSTSNKIRLFKEDLIHFDHMSAFVTIRTPDHIPYIPVKFILTYADPAFSLFQVFIRLVVFVISLVIYISLLLSDFSLKKSHISQKLMFYLDLIAIFASDPLYILEYFVESDFLKIIDSILSQLLIVATLFTAISMLKMRDVAYEDVTFSWLLNQFIPFGLAFLILSSSSIYSISLSSRYYVSKENIQTIFSILKAVLMTVYLIAFVIESIRFKSETAEEKLLLTSFGGLTFAVMVISEVKTMLSEYFGNHYILQFYSIIATGIYVFFFNYINWPVDLSKLTLEKEDEQKGEDEVVNEGLAEQLL
ncbi:hypothetical protein GPJ56_011071 [Histomonas meleagridis]|uniref:uncharacterized protein n=1 Tax=Histomonas meleagridis TaxID=135588 RepID=UPI00355A10EC|nr:hypothetical protein GPJ56_011071 [Histomonas meleagridis]KAH0800848.1 hypothetical protein GO595_006601 [Histomonas meleagridis]